MASVTLLLSGIWSAIKGISWQVWLFILALVLVAASFIYVGSLKLDVVNLTNANTTLQSNLSQVSNDLDSANKNNTQLREEARLANAKLNAYQAVLGDADIVVDLARQKMAKDAKREAVVGKKPGLVTIKTKKSYDSLEREFQCVSGQLESCYPASSSSDAKTPTKKK